jgi:hypothetical protein
MVDTLVLRFHKYSLLEEYGCNLVHPNLDLNEEKRKIIFSECFLLDDDEPQLFLAIQ